MTRSTAAARICLVHADRALGPVTADMVEALRAAGAEVAVLRPGRDLLALTDGGAAHDLYVLKHSDEVTLTAAAVLHAAGAATFNRYPAVAACRDKAVATRILASAGLPVPESHLVTDPAAAAPLLAGGAIVVKPNRGSKGRGVQVVRTTAELRGIAAAEGPSIVQRHHAPEGLDRKLYRIGDAVHCVGRPWPAVTPEDKRGVLLEVDDELRAIAMGVGEALGIDTLGADVVYAEGRAWLVDVSSFPGFKGVPDAGCLLADRVLRAAGAPLLEAVR